MPRPSPKSGKRSQPQPAPPDVVSPIWLVKAIALTVLAALFCGYLTFCWLFYQGQWQLVLHPTRTSANPASISGISYEPIHFGPDESANPQLTGWWIPSDPGGRYAHLTILFLPDGNGSLANSIPTLASLHNLGINVFAFDYRGYGQSAASPPQPAKHDTATPTPPGSTSPTPAASPRNTSSPTEPASEPRSQPISPSRTPPSLPSSSTRPAPISST